MPPHTAINSRSHLFPFPMASISDCIDSPVSSPSSRPLALSPEPSLEFEGPYTQRFPNSDQDNNTEDSTRRQWSTEPRGSIEPQRSAKPQDIPDCGTSPADAFFFSSATLSFDTPPPSQFRPNLKRKFTEDTANFATELARSQGLSEEETAEVVQFSGVFHFIFWLSVTHGPRMVTVLTGSKTHCNLYFEQEASSCISKSNCGGQRAVDNPTCSQSESEFLSSHIYIYAVTYRTRSTSFLSL